MTECAGLRQNATLGARYRKLPILALPINYFDCERAIGSKFDLDFIGRMVFETCQVGQQDLNPLITTLKVAVLGDCAEFEKSFI